MKIFIRELFLFYFSFFCFWDFSPLVSLYSLFWSVLLNTLLKNLVTPSYQAPNELIGSSVCGQGLLADWLHCRPSSWVLLLGDHQPISLFREKSFSHLFGIDQPGYQYFLSQVVAGISLFRLRFSVNSFFFFFFQYDTPFLRCALCPQVQISSFTLFAVF